MTEPVKLEDYDSESVVYCTKCYSLKIKHDDDADFDYCGKCGCTDVAETTIEEWEKKYEGRYGKKFAEKSNDIRKSPIFQLSFSKLMKKVSDSPKWETIIKTIYNNFPKGLSKADSVILFFNMLLKENQMDRLKGLLYKMKI